MSSPVTPPAHGQHIPALDGIRGLAIALVMFQHFFMHVEKGTSVVDDVVFAVAGRSWMGVDLFFVLSGFLITGILWDTKGREGYWRNFYLRRVLRIFPAYYAALFLFFVVLPLVGNAALQAWVEAGSKGQIWHWLYLSNFYIAAEGSWYPDHVPNVFWSLAIEEQFYLVWPFVVLACGRRALLTTCVILFFAAQAIRLYLATATDWNWVSAFVFTPARMDGLVLGALLAMLHRSGVDRLRSRRLMLGLGLLGLLPLAYLETQRGADWREDASQTFRFACVALCGGSLLWLAVTGDARSALQRIFHNPVLRFFGKYSYAMYLWHGPAVNLASVIFDPNETALIGGSRLPAQLVYSALALALTIAFSLLSWWLIEIHFLRLKPRLAPTPPRG